MSPGDSHLLPVPRPFKYPVGKMEPLAREFHGRIAELGAAMEEKKETLIALLQKDGDPVKIENLPKEMAGIQDEIQKEVIAHITKLKKILDPGQQQRFFDLYAPEHDPCAKSLVARNGGK